MNIYSSLFLSLAFVTKAEYNFILTNASCFHDGLCDFAVPGTAAGSFPNGYERAEFTMVNTARMFPSEYASSAVGKHQYGTYGPQVEYDRTSGECGNPQENPMWLSVDAMEAGRFYNYDCSVCPESCSPHQTCSASCDLFGGGCGFGDRANVFGR